MTSHVVQWSQSLTTNHEVPGSIPGYTVGSFLEGEDSRGDHGLDNVTAPHGRPKFRSRLHSCHAQDGGPRNPQRTCGGIIHSFIHSFISIQPQRLGWQEPEPSHVTGMTLAHCILGKFLGVVCHCFPQPLDVPTFAARCLYVRKDARDPSSERWKCGREIVQ